MVHLAVVDVLEGVEIGHVLAVELAVSNGVPSSPYALVALALADPFDVGREVQALVHFGHVLDQLGLNREGKT